MINDVFTYLNLQLSGNYLFAVGASFGWGLLSILLSPCHLSSIPLVIGYINKNGVPTAKIAIYNSLSFAFGAALTIAAIGGLTAAFGRLIGDIGAFGNYAVAAVFFAAGLYLLDVLKFDWNSSGMTKVRSNGLMMAFLLGLMFGVGLGPCTFAFMAPVLAAAFHYASSNITLAILLLLSFTAGHSFVITGAGLISVKIGNYLKWTETSKGIHILKKVCGALVVCGGVYMICNVS